MRISCSNSGQPFGSRWCSAKCFHRLRDLSAKRFGLLLPEILGKRHVDKVRRRLFVVCAASSHRSSPKWGGESPWRFSFPFPQPATTTNPQANNHVTAILTRFTSKKPPAQRTVRLARCDLNTARHLGVRQNRKKAVKKVRNQIPIRFLPPYLSVSPPAPLPDAASRGRGLCRVEGADRKGRKNLGRTETRADASQ